jgi:hypothetical protein
MSAVVAIVGSRDYPQEERVRAYVRSLPPGTTVVSGGRTAANWPSWRGQGVDVWAAEEALSAGLTLVEHQPNRDHGVPGCYYARNEEIVREVDRARKAGQDGWVAAFSKKPITPGTKRTIGYARKYGVPVQVEPPPYGGLL